jgi:hypothetical protein
MSTWRIGGSLSGRFGPLAWFWLGAALAFPGSAAAAVPTHIFLAAGSVAQAQTGTIKGRLVWGDTQIPEIKELVAKGSTTAKDAEICAVKAPIMSRDLVVDPKTKGVAYGIVFLVKPKGDSTAQVKALLEKKPKVVLDQKNCEFQPYVLPFQKDQKLVIKSSDPFGHNVRFTGFNNVGVNQMVPANGEFEVKLVAESRPMELRCDIHNWMNGYLLVLDHPFFASTAADGSFEIKGVPAGAQNLIVWQGKVGYVNPGFGRGMPVAVKDGEVSDVGEVKIDPARVK